MFLSNAGFNINFRGINSNYSANSFNKYPNLAPLKTDTVSFGALKKSKFEGLDLAVVNKFKAPIQNFNTNEDFQNWCFKKADEISKTNYPGRQQETTIQRKHMLKEWSEYVLEENGEYTGAMALLILDGITKDLCNDNDALPPVLNKGVLADTISEIEENAKANKNYQFNFSKMYQMNLEKLYMGDMETETGETKTGWIEIPSKIHDEEHFDENVDKLKVLSHPNWCTKSFNARPYLEKGDFHVYLENGKPKLGVRFTGNEIEEIQGELNNSKIPLGYYEIAKQHVLENNYPTSKKATEELQNGEKLLERSRELKAELKDAIEAGDKSAIFKRFNIEYTKNDDNTYTLSEYHQPDSEISYFDIGIDEEELFKDVKEIKGNADFKESRLKTLDKLEIIGGNADFKRSSVYNIGNLKEIKGNADFEKTQVRALNNLKEVKGNINLKHSSVVDLGELTKIGGNAEFDHTKFTTLKNIEYIGGGLFLESSDVVDLGELREIGDSFNLHFPCAREFKNANVTSLKNLERIGGNAYFDNTPLEDLGNLKEIGGSANFGKSNIVSLKNLERIGSNAYFCDSKVLDLGNLKEIGGSGNFGGAKFASLQNIERIGGNATFHGSNVEDLGELKEIGGRAEFERSKITSLKNVKTIGLNKNSIDRGAFFNNSNVVDLGALEEIGGYTKLKESKLTSLQNIKRMEQADFSGSNIVDLGQLREITGDARFEYSKLTSLQNVRKIGGSAYFYASNVTDLGDLEEIGKDAVFRNYVMRSDDYSILTDLGKLKTIGGNVYTIDSITPLLKDIEVKGCII